LLHAGDYSSLIILDTVIVTLWCTFVLLVVLYILNLFIGLLCDAIKEKDKRELILDQKAEVCSCVVSFNCFFYEIIIFLKYMLFII